MKMKLFKGKKGFVLTGTWLVMTIIGISIFVLLPAMIGNFAGIKFVFSDWTPLYWIIGIIGVAMVIFRSK